MNTDSLVDLMAFTLYVGAARFDATRDQAALLRETVLPLLVQYQAGEIHQDVVFRQVEQVMGPDWNPSATWAARLDAMGFTRDSTGHTH